MKSGTRDCKSYARKRKKNMHGQEHTEAEAGGEQAEEGNEAPPEQGKEEEETAAREEETPTTAAMEADPNANPTATEKPAEAG